jgi:hypothetical protein
MNVNIATAMVIQELAERCKDIVTMRAKREVGTCLEEFGGVPRILTLDSQDTFTINFRVTMCAGDIQQIIGRVIRDPIIDADVSYEG